jgi:hypothetical protein
VARELSKARLCKQLGAFQPASERQREVAHQAPSVLADAGSGAPEPVEGVRTEPRASVHAAPGRME